MIFFALSGFCLGLAVGIALGMSSIFKELKSTAAASLDADSPESETMREEAQEAVQSRITKRKERIIEKARIDGQITNDGVEDMFCISDRTAGRYLGELVDAGKMEKVGNTGRGVYYKAL